MAVDFIGTKDITSDNIRKFWDILGMMSSDIIDDDLDSRLRDILDELINVLEEKGL